MGSGWSSDIRGEGGVGATSLSGAGGAHGLAPLGGSSSDASAEGQAGATPIPEMGGARGLVSAGGSGDAAG